jgi:hypothetical protein
LEIHSSTQAYKLTVRVKSRTEEVEAKAGGSEMNTQTSTNLFKVHALHPNSTNETRQRPKDKSVPAFELGTTVAKQASGRAQHE